MAQNSDAMAETYSALKEQFDAQDGNLEVSESELVALDILRPAPHGDNKHINHDGPVVASGSHAADPKKYYLARVGDGWIALKHLYNMIDADPAWYITGIGDIEVSGVELDDDFGDDLDISDEQIRELREWYIEESEEIFYNVDELYAAAFDGRNVYMELREPWIGLGYKTDLMDLTDDQIEYEARPAIVDARPSKPRSLDLTMAVEYAVEVSFE